MVFGGKNMWIDVFTILENKINNVATPDDLYSLAESRLHLFSAELEVPEYIDYCDYCIVLNHVEPNKNCEICHGTGLYKTTANPRAEFDFWQFGSTWLDSILDDPQTSLDEAKQPKIKGYTCGIDTNIITTDQLLEIDCLPIGLITPDLVYHNNLDLVAPSHWEENVNETLKKHPNHYVVAAACHI